MPSFNHTCIDARSGREISGFIEASSPEEAISSLKRKGLHPVSLLEKPAPAQTNCDYCRHETIPAPVRAGIVTMPALRLSDHSAWGGGGMRCSYRVGAMVLFGFLRLRLYRKCADPHHEKCGYDSDRYESHCEPPVSRLGGIPSSFGPCD